ncbi:hypothetical protein [Natrialba sp. INN-245]|uniref:DUF7287 family protein n=1 Tax=Natrialba sp. INN-245 TaxID=2690967 RepID=UPI00190F5510|nr:hypothetical protein [Natrialba sp. INN-245]
MSRERSRTVSVGLDERGQTTQDFVVGLGLFVLAVAFVFMTVPNFIATPTGSIDGGDLAQGDRVAATIVDDTETETPNELDGRDILEYDSGDLHEDLGLRETSDNDRFDRVNVTVRALNATTDDGPLEADLPGAMDGEQLAFGDEYNNQSAVQVNRIVTVRDIEEDYDGKPVRLEVRMW